MQKSTLEPGFQQVFQIYAWVRLFLLIIVFVAGFRLQLGSNFPSFHPLIASLADIQIPMLVMSFDTIAVLGLLHWTWMKDQLDIFYAPFMIIFSTIGLIIEQHLLSKHQVFTPISPFLYILLILTAWQYSFKYVVLYATGTAIFEASLMLLYPAQQIIVTPLLYSERIIYIGILARSVVFLFLGYIVSRLVTAQREQRQALALANQKLVRYATTQEQLATSRERVRLSRELHDTLAHTLSAITVQLDAVVTVWEHIPEKAQRMIDQILDTTRKGLEETRRTLSALRSNPLEEMGLVLALRTLAADFANRNCLQLHFDSPDDIEDSPIEEEHVYYRIAQEAFENISRHANAKNLFVIIKNQPHEISMEISDDGQGFDLDNKIEQGRYGLRGMKERADLINADLMIQSSSDSGTTIKISSKRL
jgi:signal transduction histidine kinase